VRDALEILEPTDAIVDQYLALIDLAEVQRLAGRDPGDALAEARVREAKGVRPGQHGRQLLGAATGAPLTF
jgi:hypothetical protein